MRTSSSKNVDAAALGVFQVARETERALLFGSNVDQNTIAPEVTIGSVGIDLPRAFITVAPTVKDGGFKPAVVALGPNRTSFGAR